MTELSRPIWGDIFSTLTAISWAFAMIFFSLAGRQMGTIQLKIQQNVCGAALLFTSIFIFGQNWSLSISRAEWGAVVLSAFLGITVADSLYMAAIRRIGASQLALVDGLYLPFVLILSRLFLAESVEWPVYTGASLVFSGVTVAHLPFKGPNWSSSSEKTGLLYAILCQLLMACCVLLLKPVLPKVPILVLTAWRFLFGSAFLILPFLARGQWALVRDSFGKNLPWRLTLPGVILGPFLATILWFAGFKYAAASRAAIFNQLSTILGVIFAGLFLKESLNQKKWLALGLAIAGGLIVFLNQQPTAG